MKVLFATVTGGGLILAVLTGCAGAPPPRGPAPEPIAIEEPTPQPEVPAEAEWTARERWESPFAVSGTGPMVIRGQRTVVVIDADPAIAEALAEREEIEEEEADGGENDQRNVTLLAPGLDDDDRPTVPARSSTRGPARPDAVARSDQADADRASIAETFGRSSPSADAEELTVDRDEEASSERDLGDRDDQARSARMDAGADDDAMGYHVVGQADTWSRIVIQYRLTSDALAAANPDADPDALEVGQILRIPVSPPVRRSHRVAPGETLRDLARRYNVSAEAIREVNRLANDRLLAGWTLIIPQARSGE